MMEVVASMVRMGWYPARLSAAVLLAAAMLLAAAVLLAGESSR